MSGICAVWRRDSAQRTSEMLSAISGGLSVESTSPVERAIERTAGVAVSARFDTQQIYESAGALVACDADLRNEDELASQIGERSPANARTAALISALYDRYGAAFVERLEGAFSIVLWDRRERQLIAAVDRFGIKRLVYYHDRDSLLIASRIDALMQGGEISPEIDLRAIANILNFSYNVAPGTIFSGVHRLLPGTRLISSGHRIRTETYWDMRYETAADRNEGRLSRKLGKVVEESVASHCNDASFENIGAFLSGGTDSSTVVGMMARTGKGRVQTFSIGFEDEAFNELGYARVAARKFGADHHTYLVSADDCFKALPDMVRAFDEPFANSSAIPTYFCARLAAQNGVRVLLAGDGGDELFGGNEWYRTDKIFAVYQRAPRFLRKRFIEPALTAMPVHGGLVNKARSYVRRSNLPGLERVLSYHFLCANAPADIFEPAFLEQLGSYSVLDAPRRYYSNAPARDHLDRILYVDVKMTLGDSDLPKVTRMSELAGIQARFPLLDRTVAEFSGSIPPNLKVKYFEKRYLFKKAFRNLLPVEVIRKKKHGFGIPVAVWLKSDRRLRELAHDLLLSRRFFERGYFQRAFIEDLFRRHEADDSTYYGDTLWTFLVLELWHRQFVDAAVKAAV